MEKIMEKICKVHLEIQQVAASETTEGPLGKFHLSTISNVDQTPLQLQGYNQTGTKTVWHCGAQSGLDKR